jgi:hypothetical protein
MASLPASAEEFPATVFVGLLKVSDEEKVGAVDPKKFQVVSQTNSSASQQSTKDWDRCSGL